MECKKGKNIGYGIVIFLLCSLMIFVVLGFSTETRSTYLKAICDDLEFDRSVFSFSTTFQSIVLAILYFLFGTFIKWFGARKMIGAGFLFLVVSFTIQSISTEIWQFYVAGSLMGAGICFTGTAINSLLIAEWFPSSKGTVTGIVLATSGLGSIASEQIITKIVYDGDRFEEENAFFAWLSDIFSVSGWRLASVFTALLFLFVGVIVVLFVRQPPQVVTKEESYKSTPTQQDILPGEKKNVFRKPYFYLCGISAFSSGFILQSTHSISKSSMLDVGFDASFIATLFSVMSMSLLIIKITIGYLTDKLGIRVTFNMCIPFGCIALATLAFMSVDAPIGAWIYAVSNALALPLVPTLIPLMVSELFPKGLYTSVLGYYMALFYVGFACGMPFINMFYDIFGTYRGILVAYSILLLVMLINSIFAMNMAARDKAITESTVVNQ